MKKIDRCPRCGKKLPEILNGVEISPYCISPIAKQEYCEHLVCINCAKGFYELWDKIRYKKSNEKKRLYYEWMKEKNPTLRIKQITP